MSLFDITAVAELMRDLTHARLALAWLCALSLLVQSLEFWRLLPAQQDSGVWRWSIQRADVAHAPAWLRRAFDLLYQPAWFRLHLLLRMLAALSLPLLGIHLINSLFLMLGSVLILIRWRGAFNGGSDFMSLVVQSGLVLASLLQPLLGEDLAWQAGLWFITIQAVTSYFISGAVKLRYAGWRNGHALPFMLDGGVYGPLAGDSLFRKPVIAVCCSWAFIVWECAFPLALLHAPTVVLWCGIAALFHFLVFWHFGLNRFFWAWCASFPAIIHCAGRLG